MDRIEVELLDLPNRSKASFLARMTQRGHEIANMNDLLDLYIKPASDKLRKSLGKLDHGTIKRFDVYTVAIVGASRRFLAQIRTHQHADFVSGSLQYSDWSDGKPEDMFVTPYELLDKPKLRDRYLLSCVGAFNDYRKIAEEAGNDAAGYVMPNGVRNVLVIQANAQAWQYMIGLRTCKRNSPETRYVMLKIWQLLRMADPEMFDMKSTGCGCQKDGCKEGKFCCGDPITFENSTPYYLLHEDFPLIEKEL